MIQHQNPNEQEIFVIYLQRIHPISPAIRLNEGEETWWGRLHHIPSGKSIPLKEMGELLPAIQRYIQSPTPIKGHGGLK